MPKIISYTTLVTEVATRLARSDITTVTAEVTVQLAQERIIKDVTRDGGYLGQEATAVGAFTPNVGTIPLPASFCQVRGFTLTGQWAGVKLYPVSPDMVDEMESTTGQPCCYAVYGTDLLIGYKPDQAYTYRLRYTSKPANLDTLNETNWFITNAPDLLFFATCLEHADAMRDSEHIQQYGQAYGIALKSFTDAQQRARIGHMPPRLRTGGGRSYSIYSDN